MDYIPPENIHGPVIRKTMRPLAEDIQKESGSTRVVIITTYELNGKTEKMAIKMHVSKDNVMERNDSKPPRPAGDKLTSEAEQSVRKIWESKPKDTGGEHV